MTGATQDISLDEALAHLLAEITPRAATEDVPLAAAHGRILRQDIDAAIDVPPQDTSAVDGYAFYHDDLASLPLPVRGHIRAGHPHEGAAPRGYAYRIFTGAPMPYGVSESPEGIESPGGGESPGPDTVAMIEACRQDDGGRVFVPPDMPRGVNLRPKGENIAKGTRILTAGTRLGAAEIGLAAAAGITRLKAAAKLRVALLSTGDEVHESGTPPNTIDGDTGGAAGGHLYDSNRPMLTALLTADGHEVLDLGIIGDDLPALAAAYAQGIAKADLVISSGGSSSGAEDHARPAIESCGGHISFWRLAMKPGRPVAVGWIADKPVFCLPGNPVAAFVCYRLLVRPGLIALQGGAVRPLLKLPLPALFDHGNKQGRAQYLRARITTDEGGRTGIAIHGRSGAGVLSSLTGADGLVEIPATCPQVNIGDVLNFIPFYEAAL